MNPDPKSYIVPPNSKESEMIILGCMLNNIDALEVAANDLDESDFYYPEHKTIFPVIKSAYNNGKPCDVHLVCEELKRQDKLESIGGASYITFLAQYAGTSAYIEEYVDIVRNKSHLRKVLDVTRNIGETVLDDPGNASEVIEKLILQSNSLKRLQSNKIPMVSIRERIQFHNATLDKYRGKKYLGLCVNTISEFNDKMLGLRKLILIAAAPNVGKTAITIQLAAEALLNEPNACLVYVSLEMDAEEIFTRLCLYLSGLNFNTYVLGSQQNEEENGYKNFFSQEELCKIDHATKAIEQIGDRLQIIDLASCTILSADNIIEYVERLKIKTGCQRAIVVIDYLQVWPTPPGIRFTSDIEADKCRIGEIKKIRDALNSVNQDPVIVISEARKPSESGNLWAGDLSDVMGSARGTYTPDAVLLLNPLTEPQLKALWSNMKMPDINYKADANDIKDPKDDSNIRGFLADKGIAICSLKMVKGRDGMKKFNILLTYHFNRNKFEAVDWNRILGIAMEEKNKKENKKHKC